jgi:hypothetical protein
MTSAGCSNARHIEVYSDRLLVVALCQGGGLHYVQCEKGEERRRGVKDLDVYSFYAAHPQ